jgi:O-antigen ligase
MLDKIFGFKVHSFLHVLGMSVLAFGLPFNKVFMSIGAIWGVSNLVLEADFKTYWTNILKNKPFKWLLAFCCLHLIAILWSSDIPYALHDLRIKLPLLAVPLALVARPITNRNHVHLIFYSLVVSLVFTSILNFGFYQQWFGPKHYSDIREMSLFGSHIRYGILIALGAGIALYMIYSKKSTLVLTIWIPLLIWFGFYTFYSQILSGVLSLIVVLLVFILFISFKYSKWITVVLSGIILLGIYGLIIFFKPQPIESLDLKNLPLKTQEGNLYLNDFKSQNRENNKLVYVSYCDYELEREWNKLSSFDYYQKDKKGQMLRNTLIRYLASKNYSKDAVGVKKLTSYDIRNIEYGIASIELLQTGIMARLNGIKYQFNNNFDPNGHSILQRLEYWKTGWHILQKNWLFGVGNGDVQLAFDQQYKKDNSILLPKNRLRAHNMYLTVGITFGIIGLFVFLGFWYAYFIQNLQNKELVALLFVAVAMSTFLIEDTIETQMGVSLISLFLGLFMTKVEKI